MAGDGVRTEDTCKRKQKNYADSAGTDGAIEVKVQRKIVQTGYPVLHELQNKPNRN